MNHGVAAILLYSPFECAREGLSSNHCKDEYTHASLYFSDHKLVPLTHNVIFSDKLNRAMNIL